MGKAGIGFRSWEAGQQNASRLHFRQEEAPRSLREIAASLRSSRRQLG
jgi:hypothetical protein